MKKESLLFLLSIFFMSACHRPERPTQLFSGLKITESTIIEADTFHLSANDENEAITIEGEKIVVDFNGAVIIGSDNMERPDLFSGTGIHISGKNITVKNAVVRGFKTAVFAEGVDSLKIESCDLGYNYRCTENDNNCDFSFLIEVENCDNFLIRNNAINYGYGGVFFINSNGGLMKNNSVRFNSGVGLAIVNSNENIFAHNQLEWNGVGISVTNSFGNSIFRNSLAHNERLMMPLGIHDEKSGRQTYFSENDYSYSFSAVEDSIVFLLKYNFEKTFPPLPDGLPTALDPTQLQGRQYILKDEWGIYDFQSPSIWLRNKNGNEYTFLLLGPPVGNYKIVDGEGWEKLNRVSGAFPATLIATAKPGAEKLSLDLEFIGQEFIDRFGQVNKKGKVFPFRWEQ